MENLSPTQQARLAELKQRIKDAGGPWTKALNKVERDEYQALLAVENPKNDPMIPLSHVLGMLDNLYTLARDGDLRAVLLRYKGEMQKFRIVTDNDIL